MASKVCTPEPPALNYIASIRDRLVDDYLQMKERALLTVMSQIPKYMEIRQWRDNIQARPSLIDTSSGFCMLTVPPSAAPAPGVDAIAALTKSPSSPCGVQMHL